MHAMHTPGPWQFKELSLGEGFEISGTEYSNNYALCSAVGKSWEEADAHLIAAAPELLEALQSIMSSKVESNPELWHRAKLAACAAIAKATGE